MGKKNQAVNMGEKRWEALTRSPKVEVGVVSENKGHSLNLKCCRSWKSSKSPVRLLSKVSRR